MKILFTALLLIGPILSFSQKLRKPLIDKITGDTTWQTTVEKVASKTSFWGTDILTVYATKIDGKIALTFNLSIGKGPLVFSINENNSAILKLSDSTVLKLPALTNAITNVNHASYGGISTSDSSISMFYSISEKNAVKLKNALVTIIRIETSKANVDFDVKEKNADKIAKLIQLIQ